MKKTLVIGLVAGAGAGKSTTAAKVFARLKDLNIDCEMAREAYKEVIWEDHGAAKTDELYILALQNHNLHKLNGKVDVIVSDASLYQKLFYKCEFFDMDPLVKAAAAQYTHLTYVIDRVKPYNPNGRYQTEEEAKRDDVTMRHILMAHDIPFTRVPGNDGGVDTIVGNILTWMQYRDKNLF